MKKLPRSAGAAALAAAAVAAGALASACGSGVPVTTSPVHPVHSQPAHPGGKVSQQSTSGTSKKSGGTSSTSASSKPGDGTATQAVTTLGPQGPSISVLAPSSPAPVPAIPTGSQLPASSIPWSQVGPGWTLAIWNPQPVTKGGGPRTAATELVLVDPAGRAYAEDTFQLGTYPAVADWAGSKQNAVLTLGSTVVDVDLVNGTTVSRFDVPNLQSVSFTRPDGTGLLIQQSLPHGTSAVARTDLEGQTRFAFVDPLGGALYTADGTELVLGATGGVSLTSNLGVPVAKLPVKGAASCSPVAWWGPGQVVAGCAVGNTANDYVVSLDGAAPVLLGPAVTMPPYDSIVHIGGSVFANMGACSTINLVKLVKGQWQMQTVPGAVYGSSQVIVGSYGDLLEVNATPSCGESRLQQPSLFWYDPITGTSTLFFGSTHGGGVVYGGLGFPTYPAADDLALTGA